VAEYIFETITAAQALAFAKGDKLILTAKPGQGASVTFRGDTAVFSHGGRSVVFRAAVFQAASAAGDIVLRSSSEERAPGGFAADTA